MLYLYVKCDDVATLGLGQSGRWYVDLRVSQYVHCFTSILAKIFCLALARNQILVESITVCRLFEPSTNRCFHFN